ncbi:hypothetical protein PL81_01840 [Streptomyces sp. RSD-27]|nr:hypothetical protein PL81_01840 [Streptomyces sp. RSD-27]
MDEESDADGDAEADADMGMRLDGDVDMETLRLLAAAAQRSGGSHGTGHSLFGPPRPGACGGPRWAHWRAVIHPIG